MSTETKATSLHDKIMSLSAGLSDVLYENPEEFHAYKLGHRDARHAAAELAAEYEAEAASKYEARVAQLVEALEGLMARSIYEGDGRWGAIYQPREADMNKARAALLSHKGER